jgi:hypothetical protein
MLHDNASVAQNKQEKCASHSSEDDMQIVSPCVKSHRAPLPDVIDGSDEQLRMLGYK